MITGDVIKYRQAAAVYLINGILFFSTFRAPSHNFGVWSTLLYTLGLVMMMGFAYLIYKEYQKFTMILAGVYAIRTVVSLVNVPLFTGIIIATFLLHALTCFMLIRAAWNLQLFTKKPITSKGVTNDN